MKKSRSKIEAFLRLSDEQKEAVVREFDREFVGETFGRLTGAQQRAWIRARRRMSKTGASAAKRISVAVSKELLDKSDRFAKQVGATRSELVERGLEAVLAGKA